MTPTLRATVEHVVRDPAGSKLTLRQVAVLLIVASEPRHRTYTSVMATELAVSSPAVTNVINRLMQLDLATRLPSSLEERGVALTEAGRKLIACLPDRFELAEIVQHVVRTGADQGLSLHRFAVLVLLDNLPGGACSFVQLGERLDAGRMAISDAARRLCGRGFVRLALEPGNKRNKVAVLQPLGRQFLRSLSHGSAMELAA